MSANLQKIMPTTITRIIAISTSIAIISIMAAVYDISTVHAQEQIDTPHSLVSALDETSQYVFVDNSGYGVMVGMIENKGFSYISAIQIQVRFYDESTSVPINIVSGTTLIDVLPPNSKTPFMIRSSIPDSSIAHASAKIINVGNSQQKESNLSLTIDDTSTIPIISNTNMYNITINGNIQNGPAPSSNTTVHVAFYDAFVPPRTLDVKTIHLENMSHNEIIGFELNTEMPQNARSFSIFAESDIYHAKPILHQHISLDFFAAPSLSDKLSKPLVISDVSLYDNAENRIGSATVGESAKIQAVMTVQSTDNENAKHAEGSYILYVQIKDASGTEQIEFIGKRGGQITAQGTQTSSVEWVPQRPGLYIAETFVWDINNVALAEPNAVLIILVK